MSFRIKLWQQNANSIFEKRKKSKNFQFANFEKYPILSPDLAMENDIV